MQQQELATAAAGTSSSSSRDQQQPPQALWGLSIYTLSRVPIILNINYLQLTKITPLLQHRTIIVGGRGHS